MFRKNIVLKHLYRLHLMKVSRAEREEYNLEKTNVYSFCKKVFAQNGSTDWWRRMVSPPPSLQEGLQSSESFFTLERVVTVPRLNSNNTYVLQK